MNIKYKGHGLLEDLKSFVLHVIKLSKFRALITTLLTYGNRHQMNNQILNLVNTKHVLI